MKKKNEIIHLPAMIPFHSNVFFKLPIFNRRCSRKSLCSIGYEYSKVNISLCPIENGFYSLTYCFLHQV